MPLSGLVLLTRPEHPTDDLLAALEAHPAIEVGEPMAGRVPVGLDTPDADADRAVWSWLRARPEVLDVVVALIRLDAEPTTDR